MLQKRLIQLIAMVLPLLATSTWAGDGLADVGVAKADITPDYPIRLNGYGNRRTESEGIEQSIWAKALAIGSDDDGPVVLITVDNCGVPATVTDEVSARLAKTSGLPRAQIAICSSHTHCAPMLSGVLPLMFGMPLPADQQTRIDRYTRELTDKLEQVALAALADRQPGRLSWDIGKVTFALNRRRTKESPVDHSLPVLRVTDADGNVRAILVRYACHATTVFGDFNRICGDWPGYAQDAIERDHPGAIALVAIGCGADAKPNLQRKIEHARQHGEEIATEVKRLVQRNEFRPVNGKVTARLEQVDLPFVTLPTREEWLERSRSSHSHTAYHAQVHLERIKRGEEIPKSLSNPVQTWTFGDDLAMVFLGGEVVVDYQRRLDRELDASRLWVNAYANDVPCYIASERVLQEGGYEADRSMIYYDRPARFAPGVEETIVSAVHRLLPAGFDDRSGETSKADPDLSGELPRLPPVEPEKALETFDVKAPFQMELVAAEPMVHDPVAMAFDADARLYVVEMRGYSEQRDEQLSAVRILDDTTGDGKYDRSTVFADKLFWPTAVACWDGGVFVADAPDIWYMKDTDGDRKADIRRRVLTGFSHHNVQAMLNSLVWGLDNRIHCTTSTGGAKIQSVDREGEAPAEPQPLTLRTRDFAFDPRTMEFATTSIGGQHGMTFDDWGRKFVCTNSNHIMQVMYADRYIARNPNLAAPASRILIAADGSQPDVYRISPLEPWRILRTKLRLEGTLMQFRLEGGGRTAGYFTAASGVTAYRGDNWPDEDRGVAVVGDVGSNLIHRMRLDPNGLEFIARRMDEQSELVASRDTWFRPVQFANGPDGCLYVADMYREIIEHPDSFGDVIKQKLHLTSGRDRGRIYRISCRVRANTVPQYSIRSLNTFSTSELVALLAHANAWHRETAARLLCERQDRAAIEPLRKLASETKSPLGRMHALYALAGLDTLTADDVMKRLGDESPRVREHAVRLSENALHSSRIRKNSDESSNEDSESSRIGQLLLTMTDDADLGVRYQLAFSLGELQSHERFTALARIARRDAGDQWLRTAVLSSLGEGADTVFGQLIADSGFRRDPAARELFSELARLVARRNKEHELKAVVDSLGSLVENEQPLAVAIVRGLGQGIGRRRYVLESIMTAQTPTPGAQQFRQIVSQAAQIATDSTVPVGQRVDAVELMRLSASADVSSSLTALLDNHHPPEVGQAALAILARSSDPGIATQIISLWPTLSPKLRSAAMEVLVVRPERAPVLLDAIEQGHLNPGELTARQVQRVCLHKDETTRERAVRLLSPARPGQRADVLARYQAVLKMSGNADRGREVFRKTCVVCHKAEGVGHELGPNLATFKQRGPEAILAAVLDPNREVNPLYATYVAVTADGLVLNGMLTAETATSITLTREEGKQDTVFRSEIDELRSTNASLMPVGLEKNIDQQAMADLIAYVMTLTK